MSAFNFSAWTSTADAADSLAGVVQSCVTTATERHGLSLRLDLLPPSCAKPHHFRLFRAALDPLLEADRASAFRLPNEAVVVIWRGPGGHHLDRALAVIRHLLADLPERLPEWERLAETFRLPEAADTLLGLIAASEPASRAGTLARDGATAPLGAIDPALLPLLERNLVQADLSSFIRRRPVSRLEESGRMARQWEERGLAFGDLAAMLVPGRSLTASPWLLHYLSRILDRRVLALLTAPDELREAPPFALTLRVESLLSAEFLRFDRALPAGLRGELLINLRPADILADPAAFRFAREFARARGYRIVLRGLSRALLAAFPLGPEGADLLQFRFQPAYAEAGLPRGIDARRLILAGVDGPAALNWGRAGGITLFKGNLARPLVAAAMI